MGKPRSAQQHCVQNIQNVKTSDVLVRPPELNHHHLHHASRPDMGHGKTMTKHRNPNPPEDTTD